jgi:UDP-glucose 4-epimerase
MSREILVTGGAGYIGSSTTFELLAAGYQPVIVDNFSTGHRKAVFSDTYYHCDLADLTGLKRIFREHRIDTVLHFSASICVGESVVHPHKYFRNNVANTINLLEAMLEADVKKIIFSSSAAVYGYPVKLPLDEHHPRRPCNPYGMSKLFVEDMIDAYGRAYGIKHVHLRCFNAAGADPEARMGEDHQPETHLIPLIAQTVLGLRKEFTVFGGNHGTKDGTCIRDYVHVADLACAHVLAVAYLDTAKNGAVFNLGTSAGYSVKEIIHKAEAIIGEKIPMRFSARRDSDPAVLPEFP